MSRDLPIKRDKKEYSRQKKQQTAGSEIRVNRAGAWRWDSSNQRMFGLAELWLISLFLSLFITSITLNSDSVSSFFIETSRAFLFMIPFGVCSFMILITGFLFSFSFH